MWQLAATFSKYLIYSHVTIFIYFHNILFFKYGMASTNSAAFISYGAVPSLQDTVFFFPAIHLRYSSQMRTLT